jgi:hypothetical protein
MQLEVEKRLWFAFCRPGGQVWWADLDWGAGTRSQLRARANSALRTQSHRVTLLLGALSGLFSLQDFGAQCKTLTQAATLHLPSRWFYQTARWAESLPFSQWNRNCTQRLSCPSCQWDHLNHLIISRDAHGLSRKLRTQLATSFLLAAKRTQFLPGRTTNRNCDPHTRVVVSLLLQRKELVVFVASEKISVFK